MQSAANIADLRLIARRRLPRGVFDYVDGGAEDEITYRRNSSDYHNWEFVPSVLRDVTHIDTSTTLLGRPLPMPVVLAPTGFTRIVEPEGELSVARAAARHDIPYSLSTLGTRSIEEVAEAGAGGRNWFQVYVWKDRGLVRNMIERAAACGYEALCITVDLAVPGRRERDVRNGMTLPPKLGLDMLLDGMRRPSWTWRFITAEPITFSNVVGLTDHDGRSAVALSSLIHDQFDASLSWSDIEWFRSVWEGPIIIKGIQSVADARRAVEHGVDAIAVSNHGGRQLEGAPTPIELIEPIVQEVGDEAEIICDGGARRGSDILKALALGARAVMVGRPYLYGLGAGGEKGVDWVLDFLTQTMRSTMALAGVRSVGEVGRDLVRRRP
jgi:L-lactate dehydrogenase (cytochrome)